MRAGIRDLLYSQDARCPAAPPTAYPTKGSVSPSRIPTAQPTVTPPLAAVSSVTKGSGSASAVTGALTASAPKE
eukprot:gene708-1335_t